ncbi:MAG: helix-turn-helix domain-containing protein [Verrucomicrobiae bacterium]|nr:helix-turn-helix domain-containing protein [Verrucomicrobiae bacterium]
MKNNTSKTTDGQTSESWIGTITACKYLEISPATLRRWIKSGRIKPKRTPTGEFRFRRSELDHLLD